MQVDLALHGMSNHALSEAAVELSARQFSEIQYVK